LEGSSRLVWGKSKIEGEGPTSGGNGLKEKRGHGFWLLGKKKRKKKKKKRTF